MAVTVGVSIGEQWHGGHQLPKVEVDDLLWGWEGSVTGFPSYPPFEVVPLKLPSVKAVEHFSPKTSVLIGSHWRFCQGQDQGKIPHCLTSVLATLVDAIRTWESIPAL